MNCDSLSSLAEELLVDQQRRLEEERKERKWEELMNCIHVIKAKILVEKTHEDIDHGTKMLDPYKGMDDPNCQ